MVLLKNENRTLPLSKSLQRIAVIGPLADAAQEMEGGWTVEGLFGGASKTHPVTILAGIRGKLGSQVQINHVGGPLPERKYPSMFDQMKGKKPEAARVRLRLPTHLRK